MEYRHCSKENFEDFSCGRVIYHRTGMPNFPVRLSLEIYGRCLNFLNNKNNISIYDPCCGGGYLLTVLGFLNMNSITEIYGSDIDLDAVELAKSNLSLLSEKGLEKRINQLSNLYNNFYKDSHKEAIESAKRIMNLITKYPNKPTTSIFQLDILSNYFFKNDSFKADIVITDVPYGNLVTWQGENVDFINTMLDNIIPVLKPNSIVAICSDKKQKITSNKFKRLEKQIIGKRKFEILALREDYNMLNTCKNCGRYSANKTISESGDQLICNLCGYTQPIKRLPLFIITGASGVGKSTVSRELFKRNSKIITMESDILWNNAFNSPENDYREYRELWLRMCKNISQGGKPVLLCGCSVPKQFENCVERRYFTDIHYIAIVSDDAVLSERLKKRNWVNNQYIENSISFNRWIKDNARNTKPNMTVLDNTNLTVEETFEQVSKWIDNKLQ